MGIYWQQGQYNQKHQRLTYIQTPHYLRSQWSFMNEDAARGKGDHLTAFAQIMGCSKERESLFADLVRKNYSILFGRTETRSDLLTQFETLILELFKYAPFPFSAQNISFIIGLNITPDFTSPFSSYPIEIAN